MGSPLAWPDHSRARTRFGETPQAIGNHHPSIAPYGLFRTADAPIQIACGTEGQWHALAGPLRFDDNPHAGARTRHQPPPRLGEHNDTVRAWLDDGIGAFAGGGDE